MANSPPDKEQPLSLRATRELTGREREQLRSEVDVAPAKPPPAQAVIAEDAGTTTVLAAAAVAAVVGLCWIVQRRRQASQSAAGAFQDQRTEPSLLLPQEQQDADLVAKPVEPAEAAAVHVPRRQGTAGTRMAIKALLWMRTLAGWASVVAAVAVVVFWSIEMTEAGGGERALNTVLLLTAAAGAIGFWLFGRIVNAMHRSHFGRPHPKFDV